METNNFCQSCSIPLENESLRGTNKDGSKNSEYCHYCFQEGAFVNPDMTLVEMQTLVREQMGKMQVPKEVIERSVNFIPSLKRWSA